ncbi:GTPase ObgE [Desulforhopalus vacuolatus]|uniref:GTPase ObgE n=1 Tax=Desulforhopalus vacuolatus TaxID=40414 RepID=UPI0019651EA1|nr:GTPase ObgE [Desulforhopalus vacuolatus]MBM9519033.1 GTPase ObgE [Desulforhopalus vacuolatus]
MSFIDEAKFYVKAGDGGNGCVSFRREKFVPRGGPNGGDGGRGGDVILVATSALNSLLDFKFKSHFKADRGAHGKGSDMHGRGGKDCLVKVPVGSIIKDDETGEVIVDLSEDGARFVIGHGGAGGLGNPHFSSGTNRTPRQSTNGAPGDEQWLRIELKLLADVGLVGLPNAGKSTLLSKLSAANPKIAPYPFTTLEPQLGVLHYKYYPSCIIADIPGLVEGAHLGVGLGDTFLRHVERTSILLHVLDMSDEKAIENYEIISRELALYKDELAERTRILVLNKKDQMIPEIEEELLRYFKPLNLNVLLVSGKTGEGLEELKELLCTTLESKRLAEQKKQKEENPPTDLNLSE